MTQGHLLFSSVATWVATGDRYSVADAVKIMEREKMTYWIWYVPVPPGTAYDIQWFAPQVEGATCIDTVEYAKGRKVIRASVGKAVSAF